MSKITELAEREAAAAEAEFPDDGAAPDEAKPPDEGTPPDEAQPPDVPAEPAPDVEAMGKAIEKAHDGYERALKRIDGLGFEHWQECDTCQTMGYLPPDVTPPPPVVEAPDKRVCDGCNGWGVQTTPSLAPNHGAEQCIKCFGNGWLTKPIDVPPAPPPAGAYPDNGAAAGYQDVHATPGAVAIPPDAWGRPWGHVHYGRNPVEVTG